MPGIPPRSAPLRGDSPEFSQAVAPTDAKMSGEVPVKSPRINIAFEIFDAFGAICGYEWHRDGGSEGCSITEDVI